MTLFAGKYVEFQISFLRKVREGRYKSIEELMFEIDSTRFTDVKHEDLRKRHNELKKFTLDTIKRYPKEESKPNVDSKTSSDEEFCIQLYGKYL